MESVFTVPTDLMVEGEGDEDEGEGEGEGEGSEELSSKKPRN